MGPSICPQEKRQIKRVIVNINSDIKEPGHIQYFLFKKPSPDNTHIHTHSDPFKINPNIADRHQKPLEHSSLEWMDA